MAADPTSAGARREALLVWLKLLLLLLVVFAFGGLVFPLRLLSH